ncbi:hypothetical protein GC174_00930 [bacterium]|nr:hypothetical protein [bacterium]
MRSNSRPGAAGYESGAKRHQIRLLSSSRIPAIGISPEEIPRVFDKFWRSPKNTGQVVGTGLGLYLCKQVIDAHHGEISVEPGQSEGTLMRISFNT